MEKFKIRQNLYNDLYQKKHTEVHLRSSHASTGNSAVKKSTSTVRPQPSRQIPQSQVAVAQKSASSVQSKDKSIEDILTNEGFEEF